MRPLFVLWCVLLSSAAWAQQASSIAGVVKDTSGAVLPGVTVEAASPALIEKVRSVVTDGEGRYNITDLRPGTYVVTFTLPGFNTLKREGITLTAGFTATVNADMQVGALEETITVTGAAPLVDTTNVQQQKVVSSELLTALPTGSKALQNLVALTPGMNGTADVGGSSGLYRSNGPRASTFHGKGGVKVLFDNMNILSAGGTGASNGYLPNPAFAEESTVETGGISAESRSSGILMNMVPKTGSNTFAYNVSLLGTNEHLQSDNLTDDLRARGLTATAKVLHLYDANLSVGGPIKQDRLWFFTAGRLVGNQNSVVGVYFNATPHSPIFTPDLSRPGYRKEWIQSGGGRLTWQATQKTKVSGIADFQKFIDRGRGEFTDPLAYILMFNLSPQGLFQVSASSVRTSKLLLEAGASFTENRWPYPSPGDGVFASAPNDINITELSTGFQYNAKQTYSNQVDQYRAAERFGVSYVTGSHAFKTGVQLEEGIYNMEQEVHGDVSYTFLNGAPNIITEWATPYLVKQRSLEIGLFAQDQWAIKRLTVNYGLRFDYLNGRVPAQHLDATQFVPLARDFAAITGLPRWKDVEPRMGLSYDLFGNGRTALKVSLGRYVEQMGTGIADANNPIVTSVLSATRTWNDTNGNYIPDCVLTNPVINGECGVINNVNFGKNNPNATRYDPALLSGSRSYAWDLGAEVQHQLRPGLSVTAGYYHNWAGNFRVTDNLAVTPADFQPYCVTAPVDALLPGGGGYQVCGLYDVAPAKFGQVVNLVTSASQSTFVAQTQAAGATYKVNCGVAGNLAGVATRGTGAPPCGLSDFIGISVNTRFGKGGQIGGGVDTGRTATDNCLVIDSPQQLLNCHVVAPLKAQTQVKAFGTYPLPADFTVSATLQNLSGAPFEANWNAPNAVIAPSLGHNLAACGTRVTCTATATVPLIAPMTQFLPRRTQLDLRLTKALKFGSKARLQANLDLYNALNTSAILAVNSTYGSIWQRPVSDNAIGQVDPILPGRLIQFGGQFSF